MTGPYVVFHGGTGYGWHVCDQRRGTRNTSVAGPYTTREQAQAEADRRNAELAATRRAPHALAEALALATPVRNTHSGGLLHFLETQSDLNSATAKAFGAFSLMHDRYDAELGEIRARLALVEDACREITARLDQLNRLHSVKA